MSKETILKKLEPLLGIYAKEFFVNYDSDIMESPLSLSACDSAAFFLDVERELTIDLNELIPCLSIFSLNAIADRIIELYETKK